MTRFPVISGWSAVSPYGMGAEPFTAGIGARASAVRPHGGERWPGTEARAGAVPDFDARVALGGKGTRTMDRATALAVAAVGMLLADSQDDHDESALVLGTSAGSVASIMGFTRDALTRDKPYLVDPARFPNTVMNCAAGQSAIWHGLRGPNVTVAGGQVTGLLALNYAVRLHRRGYAKRVLFGAVEELSVERAWLEWHARRSSDEPFVLGEGCAVLMLEAPDCARRAGRAALADVLAVEVAAAPEPAAASAALERCIGRALARADVAPSDVWAVAAAGAAEEEAIGRALGGAPLSVPSWELLGDTASVSAAFQLTATLALAGCERPGAGAIALITSTDRDGQLGLRARSPQPKGDRMTDPTTSAAGALDLEELREAVAEVLDLDPAEVGDDTSFIEELGVDSLMALEVMVVLERRYGVKMAESELKEVTCLSRAHALLERKLSGAR